MTGIAENYGQALYTLAKDESLAGVILQQLTSLDEAFENEPDFLRLLATPNLAKDARVGIVDNSFREKVHPYILNFLKILTEKGYARYFRDCVKVYKQHYNEDNGIISVSAVTAVALSDLQQEKLQQKLESVIGKKVELLFRVDPACLGGVRLDYDGKRIDGTVLNRLDNMRQMLKNAIL